MERFNKLLIQLYKFGLVGGIAFLIDSCILFVLTEYFNIHYLISSTISFIVATIWNYFLSVFWIFDVTKVEKKTQELTSFFILSIIGLGINQLLMYIFVEYIQIYYLFAKVISTCIVMIYNFITRKLFMERK